MANKNALNQVNNTDVSVLVPENIGKGLEFNPKNSQYDVAISSDNGNLLTLRNNGLYYGIEAPPDTSNLYVSSSKGNDSNKGTKDSPLRTIREAFRRNSQGQFFTVNLYENDEHEWRSSWGKFNNYAWTIQPYGEVFERVYADNPVLTIQWARSKQIKRPTIKFVFDRPSAVSTLFLGNIQDIFQQQCIINSCILKIDNSKNSEYTGRAARSIFGDASGIIKIWLRGCEIYTIDNTYLFNVGALSNIVVDHCKVFPSSTGKFCYIEQQGACILGFRAMSNSSTMKNEKITGNNAQGVPTSLTSNGITKTDEFLATFGGKTTVQDIGIIT